MNKKIMLITVLSIFCAVSAFAQGKLLQTVERGVKQAKFVQKASIPSVVNGYLRTPSVTRFTLPSGEAMRAVRFSRNIRVAKEGLLIPENTLAVVNQAGKITLFGPEETLPAEIRESMDAAYEAEHPEWAEIRIMFAGLEPVVEPEGKPWTGLASYDNQVDLALDVAAYHEGTAEETVYDIFQGKEKKVYRVPTANIYYQPSGRAGRYLDPERDLVFVSADGRDGQIIFDGLTDEGWRMFYTNAPRP